MKVLSEDLKVPNKLQVWHFPIRNGKPKILGVADENGAFTVISILADYTDTAVVMMEDSDPDGEEWVPYFNDKLNAQWDGTVEHFETINV